VVLLSPDYYRAAVAWRNSARAPRQHGCRLLFDAQRSTSHHSASNAYDRRVGQLGDWLDVVCGPPDPDLSQCSVTTACPNLRPTAGLARKDLPEDALMERNDHGAAQLARLALGARLVWAVGHGRTLDRRVAPGLRAQWSPPGKARLLQSRITVRRAGEHAGGAWRWRRAAAEV